MSQHRIVTTYQGEPVTVLMGYDRPLKYYFLVVERDVAEDRDDDRAGSTMIYSNLNERDAFKKDLAYYRAKLSELGIEVLTTMFEQIARDGDRNVGNRYVWYEADGTFTDAPADISGATFPTPKWNHPVGELQTEKHNMTIRPLAALGGDEAVFVVYTANAPGAPAKCAVRQTLLNHFGSALFKIPTMLSKDYPQRGQIERKP
jgi:hypothetical protein